MKNLAEKQNIPDILGLFGNFRIVLFLYDILGFLGGMETLRRRNGEMKNIKNYMEKLIHGNTITDFLTTHLFIRKKFIRK